MSFTITTPRGEVAIRPTREDDAPAYRALRLAALLAHPQAFGADHETSAARPIEYWQERMRSGAGGEHGVTYVAEASGALIGMSSLVRNELSKTRHSASIFGVYVHQSWRGAGVADALIEACLDYARALQLRLVRLAAVTSNASAIRLYLRHGFSVYGVEPESLYVDGIYYDELMLARRL